MVSVAIKDNEKNQLQAKQLAACEAALSCARRDYNRAVKALLTLAREGDYIVRQRSAECLTEIGGKYAIVGLLDLLDDPSADVRKTAIWGLGKLRVHSAKDKIKHIFKRDEDISVRIIAARVLGRLGDKSVLTLIIRLLEEGDEYTKRLAVVALEDIIGQKFSPTRDGIKSAKRYLDANLSKYIS